MILPIQFLWEQLNGPQITGVVSGIYGYIKNEFDHLLDYWNEFSIKKANDAHLSTIGTLMDIGRPIVQISESNDVLFSDGYSHPTQYGFTDGVLGEGGHFSDIKKVTPSTKELLNSTLYRSLLQAVADGKGEVGSLRLLDSVCTLMHDSDVGTVGGYAHTFTWQESIDVTQNRGVGDVVLSIGSVSDWQHPFTIEEALHSLADNTYAPVPRLFISLNI